MSDEATEKSSPQAERETQSQRWAKYGSNVVLTVILAIVVAGLITYIAQAGDKRLDTTAQGVNSLKPQTLNVLHDLKTDIKVVSLYTKSEAVAGADTNIRTVNKPAFVAALLDNYKRASGHITTEVIDPVSEKGKVDQLVNELDQRYGQGIKDYQDFLAQYGGAYKQLTNLVATEAQKVSNLPTDSLGNDQTARSVQSVIDWVQTNMARALQNNYEAATRHGKEHHPQKKEIADSV
jgi:hypothetical protein